MSTLADILIPLAGSISNEKALKMREACDSLEAKIDVAQRGMNHAHDLISLLTDRVKELERDNLDRRLTSLERAVDVLDRQRVETLKLRVNGLERDYVRKGEVGSYIIALRREVLERVEKLESATKNTGEGRAEEALSGNGRDQERAQPVRAAPPVAQALDVAGEGREPSRQAAPSPAPSVPAPATGEVPKWVPSPRELVSAHYQGIKENLDAEHIWDHVRRLIASRAPSAPVVDVNALLTRFYSELDVCDLESKAMARALASQGVRTKDGA